jgi:hypothetical protein
MGIAARRAAPTRDPEDPAPRPSKEVTVMEWALALASGFVLVLLVAPLIVLLLALAALGATGFLPGSKTVSRTSFDCPFSKRRATVDFLVGPTSGQPLDVLSCSVFSKPYHVRCKKGCLALAETGWTPPPMMPRFALLSGGVAYRGAPMPRDGAPGKAPEGDLARVA